MERKRKKQCPDSGHWFCNSNLVMSPDTPYATFPVFLSVQPLLPGADLCAYLNEIAAYLNEIESYLMEIGLKVVEGASQTPQVSFVFSLKYTYWIGSHTKTSRTLYVIYNNINIY